MQFQPLFTLRLYSHYFKVLNATPRAQSVILPYTHKYTSRTFVKERGKWVSKPDKFYGYRSPDRTEFRFHINQLPEFKDYLAKNYIQEHLYVVEQAPLHQACKIKVKPRGPKQPRDYQIPIIDYVVEKNDNRSKLVGIQTGRGKGFVSITSICRLGERTVVMVKPTYIDKWAAELMELTTATNRDIMVVQGGDHLRGLIQLAQDGNLHAPFIIISNRTFQNYLKSFELDPHGADFLSYECHPEVFFETLGAGILLIDEVHQEFYATFRTLLYTNIELVLALSATLFHNDAFMEKVYNVAFPKALRCDTLALEKYVKAYAVAYNFKEPDKIRTMEYGSNNYSHGAFEKSIIYRPYVLKPYMGMLKFLVDAAYIKEYMPGDKVLVFAASISLCTHLVRYFKQCYPHLDVRRYVENDPYENIMEADITVSTLLSAGTALDVPGLRAVINSINVDSSQANVQGLGRLRELKDRDVKYYYTYCEQLEKHKAYHYRRMALIRDRVASIKELVYPHRI